MYRLSHVRVGDLTTDPRVQRTTSQQQVDAMVRNYAEVNLGAVIVSERSDGSLHIMDGGHRALATEQVLGPDAQVPAVIHTGLGLDEEARMFLALNDRRSVRPLDKFGVRLIAGDVVAKRVEAAVHAAGWTIGGGGILAVGALEDVYHGAGVPGVVRGQTFPDALQAALTVTRNAWGTADKDARNGHIIHGIGAVFVFHPRASVDRMAHQLAKSGGAARFYGNMRQRVAGTHNGLFKAGAALALEHYNTHLRTQRLRPVWAVTDDEVDQ